MTLPCIRFFIGQFSISFNDKKDLYAVFFCGSDSGFTFRASNALKKSFPSIFRVSSSFFCFDFASRYSDSLNSRWINCATVSRYLSLERMVQNSSNARLKFQEIPSSKLFSAYFSTKCVNSWLLGSPTLDRTMSITVSKSSFSSMMISKS